MFGDWLNIQCRNTITVFEPDSAGFQTFRAGSFTTYGFADSVLHDVVIDLSVSSRTCSSSLGFVGSELRLPIYPLPFVDAGKVSNSVNFVSSALTVTLKPLPATYSATSRNVVSFMFSTLAVVLKPLPTFTATSRTAIAFAASTLA